MNLRFDLRTLQIFVSVVELRSVTRAAERQNIAPSAVSKRISDLELALNAPLLLRQPRGVEATSAGRALYQHAVTVLGSVDRLVGELADYANGAKGHVRLLVNKSSIVQFLPEDLHSFGLRYPEVKVDLEEDNSPGILKGVADGRADIGVFTHGAADGTDLELIDYRRDRLVVIVPRGHPLEARECVTFAEALTYELIGMLAITAWNALLTSGAERTGATLSVRYRVTSFDALCRMVSAGLGIAVAPAGLLRAIPDPDLRAIRLDEDWVDRRLMVAVRASKLLSAPARMLLDHLVEQSRLAGDGVAAVMRDGHGSWSEKTPVAD